MENVMKESIVIGQVACAEICDCGQSVVVSLGALSLRLDLATAHDVSTTINRALSLVAERDLAAARAAASDGVGSAGPSGDPN